MNEVKYYPIELLHWAGMKDENIDELINILEAHPEYINETNDFGDNCLFIAAKTGNVEMVKYIIQNTSIDVNHTNTEGDGSAMLVALAENHMNVVNYFLDETNINIHIKNKKGEGVYHLAARAGNADLIEKLLEIDPEKRIGDLDENKRHCLFHVLENYSFHKDYWCFELILGALTDEQLWKRDIDGLNIIDFAESKKVHKYENYTVDARKTYEPLINILMSRTTYSKLKESLPEKEDFQEQKKTKI